MQILVPCLPPCVTLAATGMNEQGQTTGPPLMTAPASYLAAFVSTLTTRPLLSARRLTTLPLPSLT